MVSSCDGEFAQLEVIYYHTGKSYRQVALDSHGVVATVVVENNATQEAGIETVVESKVASYGAVAHHTECIVAKVYF